MMRKSVTMPLLLACGMPNMAQEKPNVIILNVDDMGYSDPSCYGGDYVATPNIDRLAEEGLRFTQFYTSCPISSPSRTGLTTGMYPTRWGINTFLQERAGNAKNDQNDFLDDRAPTMAKAFKSNGYVTGHFGKWHMGGGRDVKNAPAITNYGFDEYSSTWESPDPDPKLTSSNWIWAPTDEVKRWDRTAYFVDKTLDFLSRHKGECCFVNLWPDDVHTPWVYENDESTQRESAASFSIVLKELDRQVGRLMQGLKELGIDENTIVVFTSDNGPAPAFDGHRTNDFRGQKGTLYEGGIRMPFIIRWPGTIAPGQLNNESVMCTVDLLPSLCAITGAEIPAEFPLDGIDMSRTLLGIEKEVRHSPLFWEFGRTKADRVSPHIAVREGDWKLLVNADGSSVELYDMKSDCNERNNVASSNPEVTAELKAKAIAWFDEAYREYADHVVRVAVDGDASADGSSWENVTTLEHALELARQSARAQVWLKSGVYGVSSSVNVDNVAIYGGFAGKEGRLHERDWRANPSIIDGGGKVSPLRNHALEASVGTILDGVVVQNGVNQSSANGNGNGGGAILTNGAVVRNCVFRNNRTQGGKNGAAIHCHLGHVRIENSLFVNNTSSGNGGAVQVGGNATATVLNCTFANNKSSGPGGAVGTGNGTSNLNLVNTIAYHNMGGERYGSYGQNSDVNGGGVVVSRNSAVESHSSKFADGDDVSHLSLSEDIMPMFENPASITGCAGNDEELRIVVAASYRLLDGSPCIDAGNASLASDLKLDLDGLRRLSGRQVDMGAYEYDNGLPMDETPIIRVAVGGDENGDGSSWDKATTLEHASDMADSYVIKSQLWLKEGLYVVSNTINVDKMEMYGGFDGTEDGLDERDWHANPSIIDGGGKVSPLRNHALDMSVGTVLDGIIVQNGVNQPSANGNGNGGGAILANGALVRNCVFRNNRTQGGRNGAAIHCHLGHVRIENSLFVNNTSTGNGGAVQVGGGVVATMVNCTLANNKSAGPGGAVGTGNDASGLNMFNTIAYQNMGGGVYSSYGQNSNVDGGGVVVSRNSAIESGSVKFSDGDDVAHVALSDDVPPGFERAATFVGCASGEEQVAEVLGASYMLKEGSVCIDAGDDNYAVGAVYDLAKNNRVKGLHVDVGAYESDVETSVGCVGKNAKTNVYFKSGKIHVVDAKVNDDLSLYTMDGMLLLKRQVPSEAFSVEWDRQGVFLMRLGGSMFKLSIY